MEKHTVYLIVLVNALLIVAFITIIHRAIILKMKKKYHEHINRLESELKRTEQDYISLLNDKGFLGNSHDDKMAG